jgi:hypothetical protein
MSLAESLETGTLRGISAPLFDKPAKSPPPVDALKNLPI